MDGCDKAEVEVFAHDVAGRPGRGQVVTAIGPAGEVAGATGRDGWLELCVEPGPYWFEMGGDSLAVWVPPGGIPVVFYGSLTDPMGRRTLRAHALESLPVGRSIEDAMVLVPGAVVTGAGVSLSGAPPEDTLWILDGIALASGPTSRRPAEGPSLQPGHGVAALLTRR